MNVFSFLLRIEKDATNQKILKEFIEDIGQQAGKIQKI